MLKKLTGAIVGLLMTISFAFAQVDVNKADQATLDGVKGIGPKISQSIVDERTKNGKFKDWADFEERVKGIGDKSAANMSESGLTVNGQSKPGAAAARNDTKTTASSTKADKADKADKKVSAKTDKSQTAPTSSGTSGTSSGASDKSDAKKETKSSKTSSAASDKSDTKKETKSSKKSSSAPASDTAGGAAPAK